MTNPEGASARTLAGGCLCGAVEYSVADEFAYAGNCHCSNCRRATGAAFKPFAGIARSKLQITRGEGELATFGAEPGGDKHCRVCGSFLFSVLNEGTFLHVAMGSLIDAPSIRPGWHIFVGSKAAWFEITDDLPQYQGHVLPSTPAPER